MPSREQENMLLGRCLQVATKQDDSLVSFDLNDAEAFVVASKLVKYSYPVASENLGNFAASLFLSLNKSPSPVESLLIANAIPLLPRFRSMLEALLRGNSK